jgi:hypothetical protein
MEDQVCNQNVGQNTAVTPGPTCTNATYCPASMQPKKQPLRCDLHPDHCEKKQTPTASASRKENPSFLGDPRFWQSAAVITQDAATLISTGGALAELSLGVIGCLGGIEFGPGGCLGGLALGDAAYNALGMNTLEGLLSGLSAFSTVVASVQTGETDFENGKIGKDVMPSVSLAVGGWFIPDAIGDAILDIIGSGHNHGLW